MFFLLFFLFPEVFVENFLIEMSRHEFPILADWILDFHSYKIHIVIWHKGEEEEQILIKKFMSFTNTFIHMFLLSLTRETLLASPPHYISQTYVWSHFDHLIWKSIGVQQGLTKLFVTLDITP